MSLRVAIALSGGVDSLVAASILKERGFHVFGVHFVTAGGRNPDSAPETGGAMDPARSPAEGPLGRAAGAVGIDLLSVDLSEEFTGRVVRPFVSDYARGRTPNPCVACNREVKFGALLKKVTALGADLLATGHYAGTGVGPDGGPCLLKGADSLKDQSYFLAMVERQAFSRVTFPLSGLTKDHVKKIAAERGLSGFVREESQDVCFAPGGDYRRVLADWNIEGGPGPIADAAGNILGTHSGLFSYTVGQRRGMGVAAGRPLYVLRLEPERNRLVAGFAEDLLSASAGVSGLNWLCPAPCGPVRVMARVRYRSRPCGALLTPLGDDCARIDFDDPVKAITPGQAAVFYSEDRVLGAGIFD